MWRTLFIFLFITNTAFAVEFNLPDSTGTLVFDRIPYRVVSVPNEKIPAGCDSAFRAGLEKQFQSLWDDCRRIGNLEPSDCQRSLFERCTRTAEEIQKMEARACEAMSAESGAIEVARAVDSQKTSQLSAADLNRRAYAATKNVIRGLEASARGLETSRANAARVMGDAACSRSSEGAAYRMEGGKFEGAIKEARMHLITTIQSRKAAAAQFAANSGLSQQRLDELVSKNPVITNGTIVTTSTVVIPGAKPAPVTAPLLPDDPPKSHTNWVPILAVGVPAAVLTALVVSKLSKSRPEAGTSPNSDSGSTSGGSSSGDESSPGSPSEPRGSGPSPSVVPGGGDLDAWKIQVDPSFTDAQRVAVATALGKIPACYRYKLQGLYVKNETLGPPARGRCTAGMFRFGGGTVYLNPRCAFGVGITVHEFFHVLGNRNGDELHGRWRPVRDAHPSCPVSRYAATNFYEDFAESGRLLTAPDNTAGARLAGACVDAKIRGLGQILNACPR